ncbi:Sn1-specific diacylglycerol lipase alpha [Gracilariopsis chorda]|uniref:sn-1-specific diacylglycerol lipase n=1 Tax=Gracilariopsis chorda TaxID=448386 RepID=A0A2V3IYH3_9FLOR|nr:Sn1-specific diacylglycerol lipase alpha [Gracilariopsis chorda]|eukprot:PXF47206.1 Sn1-specific diacylglycerol lipase alpha [Gracilariopsis chorda]
MGESQLPVPPAQPGPSESSPLLIAEGDAIINMSDSQGTLALEDIEPPIGDDRRGRHWLAFLVLPGRIAIGALGYIAGATIARRATHSRFASVTGGIVSLILGQVLVTAAESRAQNIYEDERERAERVHNERIAWFEAIQAVGKIVDNFQQGLPRPSKIRHVYMDVSFLRMLHESRYQQHVVFAKESSPSVPDVLARGRFYLEYALATYGFFMLKVCGILHPSYQAGARGTRGIDVAKYVLGLQDQNILVSHLDGERISVPRHFVALDEKHRSIVIAIRGTNSISDVITDLLCENEPFAGGYAHRGMKKASEALYTSLLPTLRTASIKYRNHSIVVTGHSLGGGVAVLLTKILLMNGFADVKCYAIAPCPVFGPRHKIDPDWSDAVECFIHADDLVPTLCFTSARQLVHHMDHLHCLPLSVTQKKDIISRKDTSFLNELLETHKYEEAARDGNDTRPLYLPSHHGVHWLLPKNDPRRSGHRQSRRKLASNNGCAPAYIGTEEYGSYTVNTKIFERILVTPSCINSHFPNSYVSAFASLGIPFSNEPLNASLLTDYTKPWYSNELG